ncbi:hypothetical protein WMY93_004860 [Mugilogobius chulae]|uniref:Reverse transcriptase domain-containing protein n=1 Tax=Mugilogobius chulae TaxID=88201 RepID=A0AAW0PY86_9GOBI
MCLQPEHESIEEKKPGDSIKTDVYVVHCGLPPFPQRQDQRFSRHQQEEDGGSVGRTGAGKSSLINAVIDQKDLLPTSTGKACTSVIIKVKANKGKRYKIAVKFVSKEEFDDLIWSTRKLVDSSNTEKIPDKESEDITEKMTPKQVAEQLTLYTKTSKRPKNKSSENPSDPPQTWYWPVVKCVTIKVPDNHLLQRVTLVDLPGTGDRNKTRNDLWKQMVSRCGTVWIVTEVNRAVSEEEAWDMLRSACRYMGNGGECSNIHFICTKSDTHEFVVFDGPLTPSAVFEVFEPVTMSLLSEIVQGMRPTNCPLDIVPSKVIKQAFDAVGPCLLSLMNSSLSTGTVPTVFKHTVSFLENNLILEKFQSGFRSRHSTESALLKVHNDILTVLDTKKSVMLLMLDLTAAFDTVDHAVLLSRLAQHVGLQGSVLQWFSSYLTDRSFAVMVDDYSSSSAPLTSGVPQGSILVGARSTRGERYASSVYGGFHKERLQKRVKHASLTREPRPAAHEPGQRRRGPGAVTVKSANTEPCVCSLLPRPRRLRLVPQAASPGPRAQPAHFHNLPP